MDIIENNPYRQLGVYSNSPTRERVANLNRLNAFLNVGRKVDFPLDLAQYLPPVNRTSETVAQANAALALPNGQLRHAQFWFIKVTPLDDIAFNHLLAGDMDGAIRIWEKKDCASSLQNRIVCTLIKGDYQNALSDANIFYSQYAQEFESIIIGNGKSNESIEDYFIDKLCDEIGINSILPLITNETWKSHVVEKAIKPLNESIQSAIEAAKSSRGKGATARYDAGVKLMNDTKETLAQLKTLLLNTDLQYQMVADKLSQEILQCGIDYFNDTEDDDAPQKASILQNYALSIAVGKLVKDRCKENVDTLRACLNFI